MPTDVELECACGKLRGAAVGVSPSAGARVSCYCGDCQAFARFLGHPGVMDERGGTDVFQYAPAKVKLTSGTATLGCLRLSEKGMYRWYCTECKTPIGNTVSPRLPFVSVIHSCMRFNGGPSRDDVLGPSLARVNTKSATPGEPISSPTLATLRVIGRCVKLLARWWVTGLGSPSPFIDEATGAPRATPRVLSPAERQALGRAPALS